MKQKAEAQYDWAVIPEDLPRKNLILITAKTPHPTFHKEDKDYPVRLFTTQELLEAARSLAHRAIGLNHLGVIEKAFTVDAQYNHGTGNVEALCYFPDEWVGKIKTLLNEGKESIFSVEYTWRDEKFTESGVEFIGLIFDKVDLLCGMNAGDKYTSAQLVESAIQISLRRGRVEAEVVVDSDKIYGSVEDLKKEYKKLQEERDRLNEILYPKSDLKKKEKKDINDKIASIELQLRGLEQRAGSMMLQEEPEAKESAVTIPDQVQDANLDASVEDPSESFFKECVACLEEFDEQTLTESQKLHDEKLGEPLHKDFQKIKNKMVKDYGEKKGSQVYYAWVNKHGYDDTKAFPDKKKKEATDDINLDYVKDPENKGGINPEQGVGKEGDTVIEGVEKGLNPDQSNKDISKSGESLVESSTDPKVPDPTPKNDPPKQDPKPTDNPPKQDPVPAQPAVAVPAVDPVPPVQDPKVPDPKDTKIAELTTRVSELETATNKLQENAVNADKDKKEAVAKARKEGKREIIDKVKGVLPPTSLVSGVHQGAYRVLVNDVKKVLHESESS